MPPRPGGGNWRIKQRDRGEHVSGLKLYYVLDNGKPTKVHHSADCIALSEHGPYKQVTAAEVRGLRACGKCGGGGSRRWS
jgi:hypothetical protein